MMIYRFRLAVIFALAIGVLALPTWAATTVNYQGHLYDRFGSPISGGVVIPVTFAAGYNPVNISCDYGDSGCNIGTEFYRLALADGKLFPVGSGASTDVLGTFSGTGTTNDPAGTRIFLVGLRDPLLLTGGGDDFGALASSTSSSYQVPVSGAANLDASLANIFIYGVAKNGGIGLDGLPIPEPCSALLAGIGFVGLAAIAMKRRS
jgi:hypothetical protein